MEAVNSDTPILVRRYGCGEVFAREFERQFKIQDSFRAERNLVEALIKLLDNRKEYEKKLDESSDHWLQNLKEIKRCGDAKGWKLAASTGRGGNPLGGMLGMYPAAATFLQTSQRFETKAYAIKSILLASMIYGNNIDHAEVAKEIGTVLRGETKSENRKALEILPSMDAMGLDKYIETVRGIIQTDDNKENRVFRIVSQILNIKIKKKDRSDQLTPERRKPTGILPKGPGPFRPTVSIDVIDIESDGEFEEEPNKVTIVSIEKSPDDDCDLNDDEVEARVNESRHWIARQESLVAVDKGRLTPAEKRQVAKKLRAALKNSDKTIRAAAGLLSLSYCLARKWSDCLNIRVDINHLDARDGSYKKKIFKPKGAYTPESDAAHLERRASKLTLKFPDPVANWIQKDVRGTGELIKILDVDEAVLKDSIDKIMNEMRFSGKYPRIRIEKIQAALPLELKLMTNDVSMIYHLLNEGGMSAPSISYYIVQRCEDIENVYKSVTSQMLDA